MLLFYLTLKSKFLDFCATLSSKVKFVKRIGFSRYTPSITCLELTFIEHLTCQILCQAFYLVCASSGMIHPVVQARNLDAIL